MPRRKLPRAIFKVFKAKCLLSSLSGTSLFFATFLYENEAPGLEQAPLLPWQQERCDPKKGIFVHPHRLPN